MRLLLQLDPGGDVQPLHRSDFSAPWVFLTPRAEVRREEFQDPVLRLSPAAAISAGTAQPAPSATISVRLMIARG